MPSDEEIFEAISRPLSAFRSALASGIEQLRATLAQLSASGPDAPDQATELGVFAAGRIDAGRFASIVTRESVSVEPATRGRIQQAHDTLAGLAGRKDALFRVDVASGTSLREAVHRAFQEVGRAFGAGRVADLARTGRFVEGDHAPWLEGFPFALWNRTERSLAPPLLVHVDGADLHAGHLEEFLDGKVKLVLIVRGPMPPAPLVSLVAPHVFVLQTEQLEALAEVAGRDGPAVAALVGEDAARWRHDPDGGPSLADRVRVAWVPETPPKQPVGGISAAQQAAQLRQLESLAAPGPAAPPRTSDNGPAAPAPSDPVDKLAAWLLAQADLSGSA